MNPLIKWPGGKSGEITRIEGYIPAYERYIEPFFGGGAMFFHLKPPRAAINDVSGALMDFYRLAQAQDAQLHDTLLGYDAGFHNLIAVCDKHYDKLHALYQQGATAQGVEGLVKSLSGEMLAGFPKGLLLDEDAFLKCVRTMVLNKMLRTCQNSRKKPFTDEDLKSNLITGFTSGCYIYFRDVYNALSLGRAAAPSRAYQAANFYFIREYCYGSMFRYNAKGEFNIPYGGLSYNQKNLHAKVESIFSPDAAKLLKRTAIHCADFEPFLADVHLTKDDFLFLDPPYDTDFSDYEGRDFTKNDQQRLADCLKAVPAKLLLVIKNTDFIRGLYEKDFIIHSFDNRYTYNVRSRNERKVEHLIITNYTL